MRLYRGLALVATLLAFGVVALGAYVRLSDAGLGCPDWPGCYGHLLGVPDAPHEQAAAAQSFPGKPVETGKAWKEMVHRYFAGTLGLLILGLAILAWRPEMRDRASPLLPTALLGIVGFQALLGMWTVTLLLKPVIVTAHLLGGMTTLGLLVWLLLRQTQTSMRPVERPNSLRPLALLALGAVIAQIALGGWTSSNYAALACTDFPTCQGNWLPTMDFGHAFALRRELGQTSDGGLLPFSALTAIHWSHRFWAVGVLLAVGGLAIRLLRLPAWRRWGLWLAGLLTLQWCLGIANVLLSLPLPIAVAHNLGAAALLAATLALNFRLWHRPASREFAYLS
jgi:cytochrome c oxidase assembly protein subunit 15